MQRGSLTLEAFLGPAIFVSTDIPLCYIFYCGVGLGRGGGGLTVAITLERLGGWQI